MPPRSLSDQIGTSIDAAAALMRSEIRLARAEMRQGLREARRGIVGVVIGVLLLLVGLLAAAGAAIAGLSLIWPVWMAAAVVAGGALLIGGALVALGSARIGRITPEQTLREARATIDAFDPRRPSNRYTSPQEHP